MTLPIKCHADGVHVGQEDMTASKVREKIGGDMMLGVSVHTVEEALEAVEKRRGLPRCRRNVLDLH